jgi:hypothetical protein
MIEALRHIEHVGLQVPGWMPVICGVILGFAGLCLWLGGLRWAKVLATLLGGAIGFGCALIFTEGQTVAVIVISAIGAGFGLFFERVTVSVGGGLVIAAVILAGFSWPALESEMKGPYPDYVPVEANTTFDVAGAKAVFVELQKQFNFFGDKIVAALKRANTVGYAVASSAALAVVICGFVLGRFSAAFSCALTGTLLVFAGMFFLLMQKGASPMVAIYSNAGYYGVASASMVAMGTFTQMLFCPDKRKKKNDKNDGDGESQADK